MPTRPSVYAYRESDRWSRTTASSTDGQDHRDQRPGELAAADAGEDGQARPARRRRPGPGRAGAGSRRPSPLSSATAGSRTGSAYGARNRITRCRPRKIDAQERGRHPEVRRDRRRSRLASTVAAVRPRPAPSRSSSSASSALRRVRAGRTPACSPAVAGGGAGTAGAVTAESSDLGRRRSVGGPAARPGRRPARPSRRAGRPAWWSAQGGPAARPPRVGAAPTDGRGGRRRRRRPGGGAPAGATGRSASGWGWTGRGRQLGQRRCASGWLSAWMPCLTCVLRDRGEVVEAGVAGRSCTLDRSSPAIWPGTPGRSRPGRRRSRRRSTAAGCTPAVHRPPPSRPSSTTAGAGGAHRVPAGRGLVVARAPRPSGSSGAAGRGAAQRGARAAGRGAVGRRSPCRGRGRRRRRRSGACLDDVLVGDVGDDHGDVVRAAAAQRELRSSRSTHWLRVGVLPQRRRRSSRR